MNINIINDRKNVTATVRIISDNAVMENLIEEILSPLCKRTDKAPTLTVVCVDGQAPEVQGPCVYVGCAPEMLGEGQTAISRPLDISSFTELCQKILSENTVFSKIGWSADVLRKKAMIRDKEVSLSAKEMELYLLLLSSIGECVSRERISEVLWNGEESSNSTDVYVCFLRKKLESISCPGVLISVRNKGYMLKKP